MRLARIGSGRPAAIRTRSALRSVCNCRDNDAVSMVNRSRSSGQTLNAYSPTQTLQSTVCRHRFLATILPLHGHGYQFQAFADGQADLAQPRQAAAPLSPSPMPTRRHASYSLPGGWNPPGHSRPYGTTAIWHTNDIKISVDVAEMTCKICYTDGELYIMQFWAHARQLSR